MADLDFDDLRKLGKTQLEAFNSAANSTARGLTALAAEATEYSKQSLDNGRVYFENLLRAQKVDEVLELQSEFCRNAYGNFFTRASRVGELCSNLAKESFVSAQSTTEQVIKSASEATDKVGASPKEEVERLAALQVRRTRETD